MNKIENTDLKANFVFTRKETADFLSICLTTLDKLDIPRIKMGRCIRYQKSDVEKWLDDNKRRKTV